MADLDLVGSDSFALNDLAALNKIINIIDSADTFTLSDASGDGTTQAVAPLVNDNAILTDVSGNRTIGLYDGPYVLSDVSDRRQLLVASDTATLTESAVVVVIFNRTDTFTLTDATATSGLAAMLSRTDSIVLSDVSSGTPPSTFNRADSLALTDSAALLVLWSVGDTFALDDAVVGGRLVGPVVSDEFFFSERAQRANVGPSPLLRDPLRAVMVNNGRAGVRVLNPSEAAVVSDGKTHATPPD